MAEAELAADARRAAVLVAACAIAGGVLALNRALVGVFYDDGLYATLAIALARGHGYVQANLPGAPAAIHYPPVYPVVLAPLFGIFSIDTAGFLGKILNLICSVAAAGLIAWHAIRARLLGDAAPRWLTPGLVAGSAVAMPVLQTQSVLFAEPLFALLLAAAILVSDSPGVSRGAGTLVLAGTLCGLALLTRTIGIAAGAGLVFFLLVVRRERWSRVLLAGVPVALAAIGWMVWTTTHRAGVDPAIAINYGSYGEVVRQTGLGAFGAAALDLPRPLAAITLGWLPSSVLIIVFGVAALAVGLYGLWLLLRRSAAGMTLVGYCGILAIWPFPPDRFLWAVLPWLVLAWGAGAIDLARRPRLRTPVFALAALLVIGFVQYEVRGLIAGWWRGDGPAISANFSELLPWLRTLPPDAVLATDDEALVWLYTGRAAVPFYLYGYRGRQEVEPVPAAQRAYLERQGVTHVVLASAASGSAHQLRALIGAFPGWLTPVHAWPGARWVYAVNRGH